MESSQINPEAGFLRIFLSQKIWIGYLRLVRFNDCPAVTRNRKKEYCEKTKKHTAWDYPTFMLY